MAQPVFPVTVAYDHNKGSYVEEYTPSQTGGQTLGYGEFCVLTAAVILRCGVNPAAITGLSEVDSEKARVLTPNGKIPIRVMNSEMTLVMSSLTVPVEATHLNNVYGITRDANGIWQVDVAKSGILTVVRLDIPNGFWYCKILASVLTNDGIVS